jgi:carbon-monoxide dehydrogenase medium subunit
MWQSYFQPAFLDETLALLAKYGADARIINGGTDLIIEIERRLRTPAIVIDISRVAGLDEIRLADGVFHLGPSVTHNQAVASPLLRQRAFPLVRACWEVGAPQIRNRGTIAGNLITASPANDTITPLWAMGASVTLQSVRGARTLKLEEFMRGVRQTALDPDEMLTDISFPALQDNEQGTFIKLGLRRAQAISVVNVAVVLGFEANRINHARITLGAVAPTIVAADEAQQFLLGKSLDEAVITKAASLAVRSAHPIDDIRSTATYRRHMVQILVARALRQLRDGTERADFPERPVLLWGQTDGRTPILNVGLETHAADVIDTTVNGQHYEIRDAGDKTLLRMLREDIGLIGTKEGCAEGECGACTVFLDGQAVMSCLVPAPRAHHAEIVTIEGLKHGDQLHPVQQTFVETGAVQCGYCSPGFIMSGAKLLEEIITPTHTEVQQAISGNLCRCTGYYKIVEAIERAAERI